MEVVTAPIISMQHDWEVALNTPTKEAAWISSSTYGIQSYSTLLLLPLPLPPRFLILNFIYYFFTCEDNQTHKTNTKHGEVTFIRNKDGLTASGSEPFSVTIVNSNLKVFIFIYLFILFFPSM
jgi:hypothetical protein